MCARSKELLRKLACSKRVLTRQKCKLRPGQNFLPKVMFLVGQSTAVQDCQPKSLFFVGKCYRSEHLPERLQCFLGGGGLVIFGQVQITWLAQMGGGLAPPHFASPPPISPQIFQWWGGGAKVILLGRDSQMWVFLQLRCTCFKLSWVRNMSIFYLILGENPKFSLLAPSALAVAH